VAVLFVSATDLLVVVVFDSVLVEEVEASGGFAFCALVLVLEVDAVELDVVVSESEEAAFMAYGLTSFVVELLLDSSFVVVSSASSSE